MTREPIEVTRQDRIYCLKASSDYHSEVCEECKFYPNCDHMTQDDMTELTINDLEALEQEPTTKIEESNFSQEQYKADLQSAYDCGKSVIDKIRAEIMEIFDEEKDVEPMWALGLKYSTHIIDKYKGESEDKE